MSFSVPTREIFMYRLVLSFCERSSEIDFSLLVCWYSLRLFDCCFACTSRQTSRVKMKSKCQNMSLFHHACLSRMKVFCPPRMLITNESLLSITHAYHEWRSSVHHVCLSRMKVFCPPRMCNNEWRSSVHRACLSRMKVFCASENGR